MVFHIMSGDSVVTNELRSFCKSTTIKGVGRALYARSRGMRCLWTISVLTLLVAAGQQSYEVISYYLDYEITTAVVEINTGPDITQESPMKDTSLTVCNLNSLSYRSVNVTDVITLQEYRDTLYNLTHCNTCSPEIADSLYPLLSTLNGYFIQIGYDGAAKVGHSLDDFIAGCNVKVVRGYTTEDVPCSQLATISTLTRRDGFNCFIISLLQNTTIESIPAGFSLDLHLAGEREIYSIFHEEWTLSRGARIYIHENHVIPDQHQNNFLLEPGKLLEVNVKTDIRQRLPPPHGTCTDGLDQYETTGYTYTTGFCVSGCIEQKVIAKCSCKDSEALDVLRPDYPEMNFCGNLQGGVYSALGEMKCLTSIRLDSFVPCLESCASPCQEMIYGVTLSQSQWPPNPLSPAFYDTMIRHRPYEEQYEDVKGIIQGERTNPVDAENAARKIRDNFLHIEVLYEHMKFMKTVDNEALHFSSMLSQLGGTLNLWAGITVVLIVEIVDFIINLVCAASCMSNQGNPVNSIRDHIPNGEITRC